MKLSEKAQESLNQVVARFQSGDLGPVVDVLRQRLYLSQDAPAAKWTFSNQVLAYAQTGCLDCRGYKQWQAVGRQVTQKGAAWILGPRMIKKEDKKSGEEKPVLAGFVGIPVHPITHTEGEPLPEYEPKEPPPLLDVAERMGVTVTWQPLPPDRNGDYSPDKDHINVGTQDVKTFFHELAHAAHKRVVGQLKGGQDTQQETVAELAATVLMQMYNMGDRSFNCWHYVKLFAKDPLHAIYAALGDVEQVLGVILGNPA